MSRLINSYRKNPTPSNRKRLQDYLDKHMMAACLASAEEVEFLRLHEFKV